jgi:peptidoglycan/xylan/chitin deacetylase (PgdA/CDA1 family)
MAIKISVLFLALLLLLAGCRAAAPVPPPEASPPPADTPAPTAPPPENTPPSAVYEYGEPAAIVDQEDSFFSCYLLYPVTGLPEVDAAVLGWARALYGTARGEIDALRAEGQSVEGELNVQYNAYLAREGYASVEEIGFYSHSLLAHQNDIVRVFNIDLAREQLLENDRVLDPARLPEVLALLRGKVLAAFPPLGDVAPDETWLEHLTLTRVGVEVVLARGERLPSALGTRRFLLTYEELGAAFILLSAPPEAETPTPDAAPTPSAAAPFQAELDPAKPMLALTFDDGPSSVTPRILDLLEQYNARATFCVIGNRVERYGDTIRRAAGLGCEIVGHSWDHKYLTKLSADQARENLRTTSEAIAAVTGAPQSLYRPPYGAVDDELQTVSAELGLSLLMWSVDPRDWQTRDPDAIYEHIADKAKDGAIIICHDIYDTTADAMERVIPMLLEKGYQLVTVSELLGGAENLEPGSQYTKK